MKQVIEKLPSDHFLVLKTVLKDEKLVNHFSSPLVLNARRLINFDKKALESNENALLNLLVYSVSEKANTEVIEKKIKDRSIVVVDISGQVKGMKQLVPFLSFVRQKLKVVLFHNEDNIEIKELPCIYVKMLNVTNELMISVPLANRRLFGKPEFELLDNTVTVKYDDLDFQNRESQNCTTCITADPGTGKSEGFREIERVWFANADLRTQYHWLIQINLIDIDEHFVEEDLEKSLVHYLCKTKFPDLSIEQQQLWIAVLKHDVGLGFVKLLLDGWDEAESNVFRRSLCMSFIEKLPATVHYDIAMRPYVFNAAPCEVYRRVELQPFTDKDLKKYLEQKFNSYAEQEINKKKLELFVKKILDWLESSDEKMLDVVRIPLLAFLLSEALKEDWLAWMNSVVSVPEGPWSDSPELNLVMLYDIFIIARAKIFLRRVSGINVENLPNEKVVLQLTSTYLISMEEIAFSELFGEDILKNTKKIDQDLYRSMLDFGIITGRKEDRFNNKKSYRYVFLQQTFKELFAALFIVRSLSNNEEDSTYSVVKDVMSELRFDVTYKVVWRFVRDLLNTGSALLSVTPNIKVRTVFTEPKDLVGVASNNLLCQLGLSDRKIKILELSPRMFMKHDGVSLTTETTSPQSANDVEHIEEKIKALTLSKNDRDRANKLLAEFPNDVLPEHRIAFCNSMGELLRSYYYRVSGPAAEKLAGVNVQITMDLANTLLGVFSNKNCRVSERLACLRAILKVNSVDFPKISVEYIKLLDDSSLENTYKNEILCCLQIMVEKTKMLESSLLEKLKKGFDVNSAKDNVLNEEIKLRRLLLIKLAIDRNNEFEGETTASLAKKVAKRLNHSRVSLIFDLITQGFITLADVKDELVAGVVAYDNRGIATSLYLELKDAIDAYHKRGAASMRKIGAEAIRGSINTMMWLSEILLRPEQLGSSSHRLFIDTNRLLTACSFEGNNNENYYRFWRLDAGIPIAILFLSDKGFCAAGFSYLIFQIRNNLSAYDVVSKVSSLIAEHPSQDSKDRCVKLYLALEYLIVHQHNVAGYFKSIDTNPGLVSAILDVAWEHFKKDKRYPLIGLDVIFALSVCFGLPLVQVNNKFKLLFPSITRYVSFSPEFTLEEQVTIKDHFEALQHICGKSFNLNKLNENFHRNSLMVESISLFMAEPTADSHNNNATLLFSFSGKTVDTKRIKHRHSIDDSEVSGMKPVTKQQVKKY